MAERTLYNKVLDLHTVDFLDDGRRQVFVGRHLMHDATSAPAFGDLREKGLKVKHPELTFAVVDHVIPTNDYSRPFLDSQAELLTKTFEDNVREFGITYFSPGNGHGICHIIFPEQGFILPGMVAVCGDSHTSTYGAFGALAFGFGTTQVFHVLATQTFAMDKELKVRRINLNGRLGMGVFSKDIALDMMRELGVKGGNGFAYEFDGSVVNSMGMESRMTLCNMAVEGGAKSGYVNPDEKTFGYLAGRRFAPKDSEFDRAIKFWESVKSDADAVYDDIKEIDVSNLAPMVTWGINPEQAIMIHETMPVVENYEGDARKEVEIAYRYMGLKPGDKIYGTPIDVVFIGSCTNGRISDLRLASRILKGKKVKVKTLIVPGSESVKREAEIEGLDRIFLEAGAEWRNPGCSMCIAMNPDKLVGYQRSASTSNRNFIGRQGSPTGRTHLMSPYSAAAAAIEGRIVDPREYM
ncbi:MAG: 3-isopropylmalate dehydratase large subunit [Nanoarchaeota archaeon]|nr:3-isopropylmalate dehydratase large subunit [Nanoarchaeota archaeon]